MTSTEPQFGAVINRNEVDDKQSGFVAVGAPLGIGLVYKDGANGWKNAPTDGSIHADQLYWNDKVLEASTAEVPKVSTFYGEGARVVGKADLGIPVDSKVKASTNVAQAFLANPDPANAVTPTAGEVDAVRDWERDTIAFYKGHALELNRVDVVPTAALDTETNGIYEIRRG